MFLLVDVDPAGSLQNVLSTFKIGCAIVFTSAVWARRTADCGRRSSCCPTRPWGLGAEPQEAQPRQLHHHGADVQHARHEDGADDVGEDVFEDDFPGAATGEPRGLEIGHFLLGQGLAAGNAGVLGPGDRHQSNDGVLQAAASPDANLTRKSFKLSY